MADPIVNGDNIEDRSLPKLKVYNGQCKVFLVCIAEKFFSLNYNFLSLKHSLILYVTIILKLILCDKQPPGSKLNFFSILKTNASCVKPKDLESLNVAMLINACLYFHFLI